MSLDKIKIPSELEIKLLELQECMNSIYNQHMGKFMETAKNSDWDGARCIAEYNKTILKIQAEHKALLDNSLTEDPRYVGIDDKILVES